MEFYACPFQLCSDTERPQCNRLEYNHPFLTAEEMCTNALRQRVASLLTPKLPHGHGQALQLVELALNTPDANEADDAFEQAATKLATFVEHPAPEPRLRAARDLNYLPIFQLRREGKVPHRQ